MNNIHYTITIDTTVKIMYWACYFIQGACTYTLKKYQKYLLQVSYHRLHKSANICGTLGQIEYITQYRVFRSSIQLIKSCYHSLQDYQSKCVQNDFSHL